LFYELLLGYALNLIFVNYEINYKIDTNPHINANLNTAKRYYTTKIMNSSTVCVMRTLPPHLSPGVTGNNTYVYTQAKLHDSMYIYNTSARGHTHKYNYIAQHTQGSDTHKSCHLLWLRFIS